MAEERAVFLVITRAILCPIFIPPEALLTDAVQAGEKGGRGDVGAGWPRGGGQAGESRARLAGGRVEGGLFQLRQ